MVVSALFSFNHPDFSREQKEKEERERDRGVKNRNRGRSRELPTQIFKTVGWTEKLRNIT